MSFVKLIFFITFLQYIHGYCVPCPSTNLSWSRIQECTCPIGLFANDNNECVTLLKCPKSPIVNLFREIYQMFPTIEDTLTKTVETINPANFDFDKDVDLALEVIDKHIKLVKELLPDMMGPIVGHLLVKNQDVLGACKGNPQCMLVEALKKPENFEYLIPQLKIMGFKVGSELFKIFQDIDNLVEERNCDYKGNCSLMRGISDFKKKMPSITEITSFIHLFGQMGRSHLSELSKSLGP